MDSSRFCADSLGSLCGPPHNTPDTRSLADGLTSLNLDAVNEDLKSKTAEMAFGDPTLVPANTPATMTPPSYFRPKVLNLPSIEEAIELLPPALASIRAPTLSSPTSPVGNQGEHGVIPITLGSPRTSTPERFAAMYASSQRAALPSSMRSSSTPRPDFDGVREHTDWQDDIEQDVERDSARLSNLVEDDHQRDPTQSAEEHYRRRLTNLLNNQNRKYVFGDLSNITRPAVPSPGSPVKTDMVTAYEFQQLSNRVDALAALLNDVLQARSQETIEFVKLKAEVAELTEKLHKEPV